MISASVDYYREIKERARFELVLANYGLEARGRGAERMTWCPFHDDKSPSCSVNLEKKLFNCFACGESGSILDFVATMEQCSIYESAQLVEQWCSFSDEAINNNASKRRTSDRVVENPPLDFELGLDAGHPYLSERGIAPQTVAKFGFGYCNHGIMKGRICIPIHDARGRLVAYVGRWPDANIPLDQLKYRLPRGFRKRLVLFNFYRCRSATEFVIVEGCWSVFRLDSLGIESVALMGRSLSRDQEMLILDSGVKRVTLLLDGDKPGRSATAEILPRLSSNIFVRTPLMPEGAEPDTMDDAALRRILQQTIK